MVEPLAEPEVVPVVEPLVESVVEPLIEPAVEPTRELTIEVTALSTGGTTLLFKSDMAGPIVRKTRRSLVVWAVAPKPLDPLEEAPPADTEALTSEEAEALAPDNEVEVGHWKIVTVAAPTLPPMPNNGEAFECNGTLTRTARVIRLVSMVVKLSKS